MKRQGFAPIIVIVLVAAALAVGGGVWWRAKKASPPQQVACTQEAKQCPDGGYVSRSGPKCEFANCPSASSGQVSAETETWKTYRNEQYGFEMKYPESLTVYFELQSPRSPSDDEVSYVVLGLKGGENDSYVDTSPSAIVVSVRNATVEKIEKDIRNDRFISSIVTTSARINDKDFVMINYNQGDIYEPVPNPPKIYSKALTTQTPYVITITNDLLSKDIFLRVLSTLKRI